MPEASRIKLNLQDAVAVLLILLIAGAFSWAGSQGSLYWQGLPIFALGTVLAFVVQWFAFIPAYLKQTEHFFDVIGSASYILVFAVAWFLSTTARPQWDPRSILVCVLVTLWALRLGGFLFLRIRSSGTDRRFNAIKPYFFRFLMTWTLQGFWIVLTSASALAAVTSVHSQPLGIFALTGVTLWIAGFLIEVVADHQKWCLRQQLDTSQSFIKQGLWAWSRHPNYFGEILLWLGISVIAIPVLSGWQWLTLVSPIFVFILLTRISGIPMLERRADKRWGEDPAYRAYKSTTPALVLRKPSPSHIHNA